MGYKTFVSLNIAIIGGGEISEAIAKNLALAGHQLAFGLKEGGLTSEGLQDEYETIQPLSTDHAAAFADVIILSAPASEVRELAYLLDDVRKKVIIDATSMHPASTEDVNTVNAIRAITGSQHVVKCYDSAKYKHLLSPLFGKLSIDLFMAGDSRKAKEIVRILAKDIGQLYCYDCGDAAKVPFMDEMHKTWLLMAQKQTTANIKPISTDKQ